MLRPTPGELLAGVRRELHEQVLPHVAEGAPTRQLRAALHVLGRLERSWDLMPSYLEVDNADLRHTLIDVAGRLGTTWTVQPPADDGDGDGDGDVPGVHDPALQSLILENAHLQAELDRMQQQRRAQRTGDTEIDGALHALHSRMAERATRAAAVLD